MIIWLLHGRNVKQLVYCRLTQRTCEKTRIWFDH